jgi:hypothetical protein
MTNRIRLIRQWSLLALSAAAAVPVVAACGSKDPPPNTAQNQQFQNPPPNGQQCPPGYPGCTPGATTGYPNTAYPPATGGPVGPATGPQPTGSTMPSQQPMGPVVTPQDQLGQLLAGIASALPGALTSPNGVPGDLAEAGLKAQAIRFAPNMSPEGSELKQALTEGQHVEMMVPMQAGKCYAILAFAVPGGVKDLDLNLLTPVSLPPYSQLAGQDTTHNNTPMIGGAPNPMCPVLALPLQYKLDVFARSGGGQVAVQVFSKTK